MSTPGSWSVPSKGTNQMIPPSGPVDGGTLFRFVDEAQGIDGDRFPFPVGDTDFTMQMQVIFSSEAKYRPSWVQVELIRMKKVGSVWVYDSTGKARRHITPPGTASGTTTFPDTFSVREFVNEDDGLFGWSLTHNAPPKIVNGETDVTEIRVDVNIWKAPNDKANIIHKLGGYNMYSDGIIR